MTHIRGLPLEEVEVETTHKKYKIVVSGKDVKCEISLPKCKVISSKLCKNAQNVELYASDVFSKYGIIRACECADADIFSVDNLRALSLSDHGENIIGSVAISNALDGYLINYYSLLPLSLLDVLFAASSYLYRKLVSTPTQFTVRGSNVQLSARIGREGELLLSSQIPQPLSFS